jgi:hypothetical protein
MAIVQQRATLERAGKVSRPRGETTRWLMLLVIALAMATLATLLAPRVLPPALEPEPGREYPGYVLAAVPSLHGW